jgi:hypothetical protein
LNKIVVKLKNRLILRLKSAKISRNIKTGFNGYCGTKTLLNPKTGWLAGAKNVRTAISGSSTQFWSDDFFDDRVVK